MDNNINSGRNTVNRPDAYGADSEYAQKSGFGRGAPSEENVDSFKAALHEKKTAGNGDQSDLTRNDPAQNEHDCIAGMFSGDNILRSMPNLNPGGTGAVSDSANPLPGNLASEIAERILVSGADKADGTVEVRINLKDSILPDTEIILRRDGDMLKITLLTTNASSHQTLVDAGPALKELLVKQRGTDENLSVEVALRSDSQGRQQDDSHNRRSRGLDYLSGVEE
jgi:hypothetical protein